MKNFIDFIVYILLRIFGFISCQLNIKSRAKFGMILGNLIRLLSKKRKLITFKHLKDAYPDKTDEWVNVTVKKCYANLGITFAEIMAFPVLNNEIIHKYIEYENIELINEVHSRGKGLILLSGHFGNWEYLAYSGGLFSGIPFTIIIKPQSNIFIDRIMNKYRTQAINKIVDMNKSARTIVKELLNGGAIALLADQSASPEKDIDIDFFGKPAATYESPAELALKFNVPIIIGFAVRQSDFTYKIKLEEIKHDDLKYDKQAVIELTKRHVNILENAIKNNPDHWAWQHRRWKH